MKNSFVNIPFEYSNLSNPKPHIDPMDKSCIFGIGKSFLKIKDLTPTNHVFALNNGVTFNYISTGKQADKIRTELGQAFTQHHVTIIIRKGYIAHGVNKNYSIGSHRLHVDKRMLISNKIFTGWDFIKFMFEKHMEDYTSKFPKYGYDQTPKSIEYLCKRENYTLRHTTNEINALVENVSLLVVSMIDTLKHIEYIMNRVNSNYLFEIVDGFNSRGYSIPVLNTTLNALCMLYGSKIENTILSDNEYILGLIDERIRGYYI